MHSSSCATYLPATVPSPHFRLLLAEGQSLHPSRKAPQPPSWVAVAIHICCKSIMAKSPSCPALSTFRARKVSAALKTSFPQQATAPTFPGPLRARGMDHCPNPPAHQLRLVRKSATPTLRRLPAHCPTRAQCRPLLGRLRCFQPAVRHSKRLWSSLQRPAGRALKLSAPARNVKPV